MADAGYSFGFMSSNNFRNYHNNPVKALQTKFDVKNCGGESFPDKYGVLPNDSSCRLLHGKYLLSYAVKLQ